MSSRAKKAVAMLLSAALFLSIAVICTHAFRGKEAFSLQKEEPIPAYVSTVDKDGDGIDDQSDILQNTKKYLAQKPQYKSVYYATGYPDDHYGVCTDVVAFAMKDAGYDLRELVNEDILSHREQYAVEVVDKNIDFRRVRNLKIYFKNNHSALTKHCENPEEWQAGDIVIFKEHIGVLSDKRNANGFPYVLHLAPGLHYEADLLKNHKVYGHYRVS